jgi:mRNA-degrading endonuclease YafQ of YafQ-DinJ toxin-antitoxin module
MNLVFSDEFMNSVKKHSSIKKAVQKKVDMIASNPITMGEPLKGNFRGYYSCPVKRNFLIIFLYCKSCRKRGDDLIVACADCTDCQDDTIKFIALGPHDEAYWG